jgi:flagellar biosynthesis protein
MSGARQLPIAVALRYDGTGAPRVTAKGRAELAERIVAAAREHGIPLQDDPALAAVLSRIPLGEEIPEALYRAVAEVIAFAYLVSGRIPPSLGAGTRQAMASGRATEPLGREAGN